MKLRTRIPKEIYIILGFSSLVGLNVHTAYSSVPITRCTTATPKANSSLPSHSFINGSPNPDYGSLYGKNKRKSFQFIIPCISNCTVELFTGRNDDGEARASFYVNGIDVISTSKNSTICYLDAPFNPNYFYEVNP